MERLSLIIPTHDRIGVLHYNLRELCHQSLSTDLWDVVVINDGGQGFSFKDEFPYKLKIIEQDNAGPATARNRGVQEATGDICVFAGDDTVANKHMLFYHYYRHSIRQGEFAIQGYTQWHPSVQDEFATFLTESSGLQANWHALEKEDGSWVDRNTNIPGWFLTTNCSITRSLFERIGGFNQRFPHAVWEDICTAITITKLGYQVFFEPNSLNSHLHKQTLDGFVKRQIMEGQSRLHLCSEHPEMAQNLLPSQTIRDTNAEMLARSLKRSKDLFYNMDESVREIKYKSWMETCQLAALEGIRIGIKKWGGVWRAIPHLHTSEQVMYIVQAASSLEKGNNGFAIFSMEWVNKDTGGGNWAVNAAFAETLIACGDFKQARFYADKAMELGTGEAWPKELLERLNGQAQLS